MILVVHANGDIALEQHDDFRRFHCEIGPALRELEAARQAFAPAGEIESTETAWVHRDALFTLGEAAGGPRWGEQARAMVSAAARHGWVRDREPAIKSHIVWRA